MADKPNYTDQEHAETVKDLATRWHETSEEVVSRLEALLPFAKAHAKAVQQQEKADESTAEVPTKVEVGEPTPNTTTPPEAATGAS